MFCFSAQKDKKDYFFDQKNFTKMYKLYYSLLLDFAVMQNSLKNTSDF